MTLLWNLWRIWWRTLRLESAYTKGCWLIMLIPPPPFSPLSHVNTKHRCLCYRYAFQIVLQTRDMLRALPSLVDIDIPNGKHFTVCGDVHGQVATYFLNILTYILLSCRICNVWIPHALFFFPVHLKYAKSWMCVLLKIVLFECSLLYDGILSLKDETL